MLKKTPYKPHFSRVTPIVWAFAAASMVAFAGEHAWDGYQTTGNSATTATAGTTAETPPTKTPEQLAKERTDALENAQKGIAAARKDIATATSNTAKLVERAKALEGFTGLTIDPSEDDSAKLLLLAAEWKGGSTPETERDALQKALDAFGADETVQGKHRLALKTHADVLAKLPAEDADAKARMAEVTQTQAEIKDAETQAANAKKRLHASIVSAFGTISKHAALIDTRLKRLEGLKKVSPDDAVANAAPLFDTLPVEIPLASSLYTFLHGEKGGLGSWKAVQAPLAGLAGKLGTPLAEADANPAHTLEALAARLRALEASYPDWLGRLSAAGVTRAQAAQALIPDFFARKPETGVRLQDMALAMDTYVSHCEAIHATASRLHGRFAEDQRKPLKDWLATLNTSLESVRDTRSRLRDLLAGDVSQFVTDQVTLYYFTDVRRLIYALNERASERSGRGDAGEYERIRKNLKQKEMDANESYDRLTQLTSRLINLSIELKGAKDELNRREVLSDSAERIYDARKQRRENAQKRVTKLEEEIAELEKEPEKNKDKIADRKERLATEKKTLERAQKDEDRAKDDFDTANAEETTAREKVDADLTQKKGLPAEIEQTRADAAAQLVGLKRLRAELANLAESEVDAFALRRDNAPYLYAPADGTSNDPAKRVMLYAYDDSKTLFIRGLAEDVELVKDIVAQFDRPAPQARLSLWTMQVNVKSTRGNRRELANAIEKMEERLNHTRRLTTLCTTLLRDAINRQVQEAQKWNAPLYMDRSGMKGLNLELYGRYCFYNEEVAKTLGFDPIDAQKNGWDYYFTRWTLPDPAGTTTLGEGLLILSLAKACYREAAVKDFDTRLRQALSADDYLKAEVIDKEPVTRSPKLLVSRYCQEKNSSAVLAFPRMLRVLGLTEALTKSAGGREGKIPDKLTAHQLEILRALKRTALERILDRMPGIIALYERIPKNLMLAVYRDIDSNKFTRSDVLTRLNDRFNLLHPDPITNSISENKTNIPLGDFDVPKEEAHVKVWLVQNRDAIAAIVPCLLWLRTEYGFGSNTYEDATKAAGRAHAEQKNGATAVQRYFRSVFPRAQANARIAAADQMLKEMVIAVEDDLDELIVQPMVIKIREAFTGKNNIDVGLLERTSLLATNRTIGRVEPKASSQFDLAGETDLIQAATQLSTLIGAVQTGNVKSIMDVSSGLNKEPKSELYALFSGSQFRVTPIFDPTGQALRFQFDYVKNTDIRDPDGTVNPQLPRVDRHAVNNVVQLSNLELREVTRFESNSKLGVTPKKWGGVPILNQMPILKDLPIVGWFSKRDGHAATSQTSLIFAQTAMYPTIGDISDLLTGSIGVPLPERPGEYTAGVMAEAEAAKAAAKRAEAAAARAEADAAAAKASEIVTTHQAEHARQSLKEAATESAAAKEAAIKADEQRQKAEAARKKAEEAKKAAEKARDEAKKRRCTSCRHTCGPKCRPGKCTCQGMNSGRGKVKTAPVKGAAQAGAK